MWSQVYDPLNNMWLSTLCASLPVLVMLGALGIFHIKAHKAALMGLGTALAVAIGVFGMPAPMAAKTAGFGAAYGLMPIGWIVVNIIFLYHLTEQRGQFTILRESITGITNDRRLQLLLIAFCFGAFFEGAAGFGTPVAVTGAMLIGLGFSPLAASGLSLIANTAPVAYGALGTPVIALAAVTGLPLEHLSAMIGRILPFFSILVPFWLIVAFAGWRGMMQIWPAILVAGLSFAIPQFLVSNFHGPWLVDVVAAVCSLVSLTVFLKIWHPSAIWHTAGGASAMTASAGAAVVDKPARADHGYTAAEVRRAWMPWLILSLLVFLWGIPAVQQFLNGISIVKFPIEGLHNMVRRMPPVVTAPHAEAAVFTLNWLSATGTGIFVAAVISGFLMGYSPREMLKTYWRTLVAIRFSLVTISAMMALGFTTRYSGVDTALGLAFAHAGVFYPFFGTMLGWLGVALTGSDTASNVLFGSLQRVSAEQLGLSAVLMAAANSAGGVMGKMIDAQSIVVAAVATKWHGHEGKILRFVFWHSIVLAALVGLLVMAIAYVPPFTHLVSGFQ